MKRLLAFAFLLAVFATIVEDRLQGDMTGEREGVMRGRAKVDAEKK